MTGLKRNIQEHVETLLGYFPAVVLLGARQTGKTTLAQQLRPDWHYVDLERPSDFNLIEADPEFFFSRHPEQLILDEAQELPVLFNILRGVIDNARDQKGRFLITGSSSPELLRNVSESLAGRVAIVEIGTLQTNEIFAQPRSPFYSIFESPLSKEKLSSVFENREPFSRQQVQTTWLKGGYPEPCINNDTFFYNQWMENYQTAYLYRDVAKLFPKLNKIAYQRFLLLLAKLSGTVINRANLARTIEVSEPTIKQYLNIAEGTFLWRQLLSYEKNSTKALVKMPKGYLRDTGLLHYLLKIHSEEDLYTAPTVGSSFEGFVIETVIKGIQSTATTNWDAFYYRTRNGAEIDLILEGAFGILPVEIKHGSSVNFRQLRTLTDFVKTRSLPFGLLINQSERPVWLSREIFQLPIGFL